MIHLAFFKMATIYMDVNKLFAVCLTWALYVTVTSQSPLYDTGSSFIKSLTNSQGQQIDIGSVKIPFYGKNYTKNLWITIDGVISFDKRVHYTDVDLSQRKGYATNDYPFIAPYYFRGEDLGSFISGNEYIGKIYYRIANDSFLKDIGQNISDAVVGIKTFTPTWGLVVTWFNVTDTNEAESSCRTPATCKTNTFQAAIATDGIETFAVFNYDRMAVQKLEHHQAGFNAGQGRGWTEALDGDELGRAAELQGSNVKGRYIFKISSDVIVRGGCRQAGAGVPLQVWPIYAGMFGGEMLEITGHCFGSNVNVRCLFQIDGQNAGMSAGYQLGSMKVKCPVPRLIGRGRVDLHLSTDGGITYMSQGIITIVHPERMNLVRLNVNLMDNWNETSPTSLTLTWNAQQLTQNNGATVSVNLIGFDDRSDMPQWAVLRTLARGVSITTGRLTFDTAEHQCLGNNCEYESGFVEVKLDDLQMAENHVALVSKGFPLGWFVNQAMINTHGSDWPRAKCVAWYNEDRKDMSWLQRLPYCPCNLNQALVDIGRWQPDMGCNIYTGSKCRFHIGAVHCVRSVQPTEKTGAGNQCCYERNGLLKYSADSFQGSTPDRSHDWGAYPYIQQGRVPSMSHAVKDVVTFYYCCLWTGYGDCDYYMDQRATRDCSGYRSPNSATIYGLGHINTFDGGDIRSCLEGDFIMLQTEGCTIQAGFEKMKIEMNGNLKTINNSVILTHLAVKSVDETAEIRIKSSASRQRLDIVVDNKMHRFDDKPMYWQDFKHMSIVNNVKPNTMNVQSNFTIILKNGIGIQVVEVHGLLEAIVMIPYDMKGKVSGMLGSWDDDASNDFNWNGQANPNMMSTNYQGQLSWKVNQTITITQHFIPTTASPDICTSSPAYTVNLGERELGTTCNGDKCCEFDYKSVNSKTLASSTLSSSKWSRIMKKFLLPVRSCGLLNVPRSEKNSYNYTLGSSVTVTGCRKGSLQGSGHTYTCEANDNTTQSWYPYVSSTCSEDTVDEADVGMIVGIVVAVVVVLLVAFVAVVCLIKRRSSNKNGQRDPERRSDSPDGKYDDTRYTEVPKRESHELRGKHSGKEMDM